MYIYTNSILKTTLEWVCFMIFETKEKFWFKFVNII